VASHRGPISYRGEEQYPSGPGGLVAVLAPALRQVGGTWIFAPSSPEDRVRAARGLIVEDGSVTLRMLDLPPGAHHEHYATISSELLSGLFHRLLDLPFEPVFGPRFRRAWTSYRWINEIYGREIAREAARHQTVLVEDMHLLLAGAAARAAGVPETPLSYFHHVPWCDPADFEIVPAPVRREILSSMLAYDIVGFHCRRWAVAFAGCCDRFLPGASASDDCIRWRGSSTAVLVSPAAIDVTETRARACSDLTGAWRDKLAQLCEGRTVIVRVERADPSKNLLRGIEAFGSLLERRPEAANTVCLLAVTTPVRQWLPLYARYLAACHKAAVQVNRRFKRPAVLLSLASDPHAHDHHRALAALRLADVVVVGSTYDGLNLVAMEAAVLGASGLVLSENAGIHDQFGDLAMSINPFDLVQTTEQIQAAIDQPRPDRERQAATRRALVEGWRPIDWVQSRCAAAH
jgi:trehalose 6-phosphate synthase